MTSSGDTGFARSEPPELEAEVESWLSTATGTDPEQVRRELEEGARRRGFVVDELLAAGFTGRQLLHEVMRLTGLTPAEARVLIDERKGRDG